MTPQFSGRSRKPRIAIMGEFSAGKSTLCNLLLNMRALPEKVTATRIAPVWLTKGPGQHMRVLTDNSEQPIDVNDLGSVPFEDTLYLRLCIDAGILDQCDFIDFPGISDPNMDPEVWERVLHEADAVIWLTHATQAWRQSEAAVWDIVPEAVREKSLLLVTRIDKVTSELDRKRVMGRVQKEAGPYFDQILPISLTGAAAARDDYDAWTDSGATALMDYMAEMIVKLANATPTQAAAAPATTPAEGAEHEAPQAIAAAPAEAPRIEPSAVRTAGPAAPAAPAEPDTPRIIPRRVKPKGSARRERPEAMRA